MYEDCDVDCQAKGSQLTVMAVLGSVMYSVVGLNAIAMFIGTWRYRWRICSVYCTFVACMLQFALLIAIGAMMFTKYNALCARSLVETADYYLYTMNDDFYWSFTSWIVSWIWMFVFVCCGMCSAYRPEKWKWRVSLLGFNGIKQAFSMTAAVLKQISQPLLKPMVITLRSLMTIIVIHATTVPVPSLFDR